jgi:GNAT superfamily N-acetyltransferase
MELTFSIAETRDAPALVAMQNRVNEDLSLRYPGGPWQPNATERGMLFGMKHAKVLLALRGSEIAGMLRLQTKKPWAIDIAYFTPVKKAVYLVGMAVEPAFQNQGVGSAMLVEAVRVARDWPAHAIRLDAYDREGGAGGFYARNGFAHRGRAVYRNSPLIYFEMVFHALPNER